MNKERILVVDDEPNMAYLIKVNLESRRYKIYKAMNGEQALKKVQSQKPDLILMDVIMPKLNGYEVCRRLKEDIFTSHIPVIMLTGIGDVDDRIMGFQMGADDYLIKPFNPKELKVRIETALERSRKGIGANPLTKLPGNVSIQNDVLRYLERNEDFAIAYLDIDNFKAFNDKYGYNNGDKVIQETAQITLNAIKDLGNHNDFVGHIGGDDFVIITVGSGIENVCAAVVKNFDKKIPRYYNNIDREKGCFFAKDRQGNRQKFPLMSLSIAVVPHSHEVKTSYGQLVDSLTDLKKYLKTLPGSNYMISRRRG